MFTGKTKFRRNIILEISKLQSEFDEFVKWSVKKKILIITSILNYKKHTILSKIPIELCCLQMFSKRLI